MGHKRQRKGKHHRTVLPDPDEAIVLRIEGCALASNPHARGDIILTDIVFAHTAGLIKKQLNTVRHPLSETKIYNGFCQLGASRPLEKDGDYTLAVYFSRAPETFLFPASQKKRIGELVEYMNEILTGVRGGFDPQSIGIVQLGRTASTFIDRAKPIAAKAAEAAQPLVPVATTLASNTKAGRATRILTGVLGTLGSMSDKTPGAALPSARASQEAVAPQRVDARQTDSLEQRIAAVKKLKELLDAGILSQEEFEAKKKRVLGL